MKAITFRLILNFGDTIDIKDNKKGMQSLDMSASSTMGWQSLTIGTSLLSLEIRCVTLLHPRQ